MLGARQGFTTIAAVVAVGWVIAHRPGLVLTGDAILVSTLRSLPAILLIAALLAPE